MAYHFRKLSQTFRFIPSSKSIGFSTRVEGDQTKNSCLDSTQVISNLPCIQLYDRALLCQYEDHGNVVIPDTYAILRSQSESDLLSRLLPLPLPLHATPAKPLPISYKDLIQIFLPKHAEATSTSSNDIFTFLSLVKSVNITSDDILVHPQTHFGKIIEDEISSRERMPVDVLSQHHYYNQQASPAVTNIFPVTLIMGSYALLNQSLQTLSADNVGHTLTHLYFSSGGNPESSKGSGKHGPTRSQLHDIKEKLEDLVSKLFKGQHNYEILHKNVTLENNLFGDNKICIGMTAYKLELWKLRLRINAQYFSTAMEILSVTTLEQTGVIRIHWRLKGLPQVQNLKFWRLFQSNKTIAKEDWEWLEAFSYFHIGKDGLVHKHRIDRMIPDNEMESGKLTDKLRGLLNPAKPLVS
ncbi:unnamed protein product [Lymnaea stagnalis]|uniref:Uncharacterized protein n=1 Tax=Lymnaea stagnalis TaxID=6523 RepID=A0AAV2HLB0_LYMST